MSKIKEFREEKVANPLDPEPRTAPRPGLKQIIAFLEGSANIPNTKASEIVSEFMQKWEEEGHKNDPGVRDFLRWLEGDL